MTDRRPDPGASSVWLRSVAKRLPEVLPGFRTLAQGWRADRSRIDLLGSAGGDAIVVGFASPGRELETLGRLLAQIQWSRPRLGDWLQLAPELGFAADAPVRALLVGPELGPEVLAAIDALPPGLVRPIHARWVGGDVWLEVAHEATPAWIESPDATRPPGELPAPLETPPEAAPSGPSPFRTGLTDADLGLSPAEMAELD